MTLCCGCAIYRLDPAWPSSLNSHGSAGPEIIMMRITIVACDRGLHCVHTCDQVKLDVLLLDMYQLASGSAPRWLPKR